MSARRSPIKSRLLIYEPSSSSLSLLSNSCIIQIYIINIILLIRPSINKFIEPRTGKHTHTHITYVCKYQHTDILTQRYILLWNRTRIFFFSERYNTIPIISNPLVTTQAISPGLFAVDRKRVSHLVWHASNSPASSRFSCTFFTCK